MTENRQGKLVNCAYAKIRKNNEDMTQEDTRKQTGSTARQQESKI